MFTRKSLLTACGATLGLVVTVGAANAGLNPSQTTYLTFTGPVQLPGLTLPTGTYVFQRASPYSAVDIVRVMNSERNRVLYMGFTEEVVRPAGLTDDVSISFGEAPRGIAPRIRVWYPYGEPTGHRFLYPAQ